MGLEYLGCNSNRIHEEQTMEKNTQGRSSKSSKNAEDAIALLMDDHKAVKQLFKQFERIKDEDGAEDEKSEIANQICMELTIHTQIEEEIFYPACREAIKDTDLLDEAKVEHASAKELISQIESMQPDDELFSAKVTVLGEYVNHHIEEEEGELFPQCKKAKMDLQSLGQELLELKEELQSEVGISPELQAKPQQPKSRPSRSSQSRKSSH
jgi:hemerythrin superfamily protein